MFTWIPIHEETAKRLLAFKDSNHELVEILARMKSSGYTTTKISDEAADGSKFQLKEIDPFTFLANFNRGTIDKNRQGMWERLKDEWHLDSDVPQDFDGIPVASAMNSWLMPYAKDRAQDHVPLLWRFFAHIMGTDPDALDVDLMQRCLKLPKVGLGMLSMGMFWACPKKWIATDGKNLAFAKTKGIGEEPKTAADYFRWLPKIREAVGGDGVEFSLQAHQWALANKPGNGNESKKDPWWKQFFDTEEQGHAAFDLLHEACLALGVTNTQGTTAQRVSLTNVRVDGKERLRLSCGNSLVFEITSPPANKPNSVFIARISEQDTSPEPEGRFSTPYAGQMLGLYRVDLDDLLKTDSAFRKLFFTALGDVAATYKNIKKRHFENAHRPRLLYAAYHKERRPDMLANGPTSGPADEEPDPKPVPTTSPGKHESAKNLILYGPPGTGKTYSTIDRALEIIDPSLVESTWNEKDGRAKRKARFDELLHAKRIGFVTFHQSFSYEDFVEGLKASTDENGQVKYEIEDGIFKQMCSTAAAAVSGASRSGSSGNVDPAGRTIWKMSLGNTLGTDATVYDECIENGYVLLGWGKGVDFSGASSREAIKSKVEAEKPEGWESEYTVTACHAFVNTMKPGDLIIVSDGNHKFRAIGVVKGGYRLLPLDDERGHIYQQCRDVEWIRTYVPPLPNDRLMTVAFSQATLYRLKPPAIDLDLMRSLLKEDEADAGDGPRPFVLIIDEINRGNISRIFGELITLIEDSKRIGNAEALSVRLPYSKEIFSVPSNLHLIGTMNTTDRSLAQVDIALRRRFVFEELMPDPSILSMIPAIAGIHAGEMLTAMNRRIEVLYDREHAIGHTFFLSLKDDPSMAEMGRIFSGRILPLLEEYFFEDWEKIRLVLGDHRKPAELAMIRPKYSDGELEALFGAEPNHPITTVYQRNESALKIPESYIGIYDPAACNGKNPSAPIS
ncbi:AAA family ATPase [Akkermansiaceae bacterium]|nr:AAA family ATPase [Akkermansiaceae bacterium]